MLRARDQLTPLGFLEEKKSEFYRVKEFLVIKCPMDFLYCFPLNLLLLQRHLPEIIIVECYVRTQQRDQNAV